MESVQVGQLCKGNEKRDAIHVAMIPQVARKRLLRSEDVDGLGIVDPFLQQPVEEGQSYWLWLKPGTVTGMRGFSCSC